MINTSLKLQNRINAKDLSLLVAVNEIANKLNIAYIVVGATARDLILHYGYDATIRRATTDVDFAIQVSDWSQFRALKNEFVNQKFKVTHSEQRLKSPDNIMIDIIPFGAIENGDSKVKWPPNEEVEMNVLGFQEAHDHAIQVIIQDNPQIKIPVVSPQGMILLKIIAWSDRDECTRKRDARDLAYIIETYEKVNYVLDRIYDNNGLIEQYNWDIPLASAHLLGNDTAIIAKKASKNYVLHILLNNLNKDNTNRLIEEMCNDIEHEYEEKFNLLQAFAKGFGIIFNN